MTNYLDMEMDKIVTKEREDLGLPEAGLVQMPLDIPELPASSISADNRRQQS